MPATQGFVDVRHQERWLDATDADPHRHHFVVHDRELGFCGELFYVVDAVHRRAELDVKLVPPAQGHGIATAGLSWLIERIFATEAGVDAVWTEPWPANHASRALYARCGLVESDRPDDLRPGPSTGSVTEAEGARASAPIWGLRLGMRQHHGPRSSALTQTRQGATAHASARPRSRRGE